MAIFKMVPNKTNVMKEVFNMSDPMSGFKSAVKNGQIRLALEHAVLLFEQDGGPREVEVEDHVIEISPPDFEDRVNAIFQDRIQTLTEEIESLKKEVAKLAPSRKVTKTKDPNPVEPKSEPESTDQTNE